MSVQKKDSPKKTGKKTPKAGKPSATVNSSDAVTPSFATPRF